MGNCNEYRRRLRSVQSSHSPFKRKKPGLFSPSGLLAPFENGKRALALPFWGKSDSLRSLALSASPVHLRRPVTTLPALSPLPRALLGPQQEAILFRPMRAVDSKQNNELRLKESSLLRRSQGTDVLDDEIECEERFLHTSHIDVSGQQIEQHYHDELSKLKERMRRDKDLRDLEAYRRKVQALERRGLASERVVAPLIAAEKAEDGFDLQEPKSSSTLTLAVAPSTSTGSEADDGRVVEQKIQEEKQRRGFPVWKELLLQSRTSSDNRLKDLESEISLLKGRLTNLQLTRKECFPKSGRVGEDKLRENEAKLTDAFVPLSEEEEKLVDKALNGRNRLEVLVMHEKSNIDITRAVLQCLLPGVWLNDEVINLYLELLKEREHRESRKFLKCHFFNTFFYNKLYKDKHAYDFKAVKRWTTQRKIGYSLLECDKIFVPIHKDIHWCLAIINVQEKKLEYLDSLKGQDTNALEVLANYIMDEAKDKLGERLDVSTWVRDCPQEIPEQLNGCDCGMFMVKYADFHSRGAPLKFNQKHMDYFRRRTALELLQLKAR